MVAHLAIALRIHKLFNPNLSPFTSDGMYVTIFRKLQQVAISVSTLILSFVNYTGLTIVGYAAVLLASNVAFFWGC